MVHVFDRRVWSFRALASLSVVAGLCACQSQALEAGPNDASPRGAEAGAAAMPDASLDHLDDSTMRPSDVAVDTAWEALSDVGATDGNCVYGGVGPGGGSIVHPTGASVVVPAGALATVTQLAICPETTAPGEAVGRAFELMPEGQTFSRPVEVVLPFEATLVTPGTHVSGVQVHMAPQGALSFTALQSSADLPARVTRATTTHFTQFVAAQTSSPVFITTSPSLPQATVGSAYSQQLAAGGGTPPYTWSVPSSTSLPPGLSLSSAGALSGTPAVPNNFAFFVEVSDSASDAVEMALSLTVNAPDSPVPTLSQISPSSAPQGSGDTTITLSGTGFVPISKAVWDGTELPTTYVGATQLAASIPSQDLLYAGTHQVSVSNVATDGGTSGSLTFSVPLSVLNPVPILVSVTPAQVPVTPADVQVSIAGDNFLSSSSAVVGSQTLATSYVSPSQLLAIVPAADLSSPGALQIGVSNPAPGGGPSQKTATVTVGTLNPTPTLTTLMPASVAAGTSAFTLTLSGTGFVDGSQAFFGGTALATTFAGPTVAQAAVPADLIANPGSAPVLLVNPAPGGGASAALNFSTAASGDAGSGPEAGSVCTGNFMVCSGTRTDVGCDPANCGTCGHSCLGGDCQGGACQPFAVTNTESALSDITVDPLGGAYWAEMGTVQNGYADGTIRHIALGATTPDTFASGVQAPVAVISDGTTVFFSTEGTLVDGGPFSSGDGQLLACPTTGCQGAPNVIADHQYGTSVLRLSPSNVYWDNGGSLTYDAGVWVAIGANLFMSALKTGGSLTSTSGCGPFAITSSAVFISPFAMNIIDEMALDGGTETPLYTGPVNATEVAIEADSNAVYWVDYYNGLPSIRVCQLPSCTNATTLFQAPQQSSISALTSDATNLYWLISGGAPVTGVYSCAKTNCTPQLLVGTPGGSSLAVAPQAVYWATVGTTIMRWAR